MATWIAQRPATGRIHLEQQSTAPLAIGQAAPLVFSALGRAGLLVALQSSEAAWISLYSTDAARSGDSQRLITTDPAAGSGVLLDAALEAGQELLLPPGCTYLNAEEPGAALLYGLLRRHQGTAEAVVVSVQLRAMVLAL